MALESGWIEQTTDGKQQDALVSRELVAVMEMDKARAAGVTRVAGMALAAKVLAGSSGGDNHCWKSGCVITWEEFGTNGSIDANKALSMWVMIKVISHVESRDLGALRVPLDVPHVFETIAHSSHGAAIHMHTECS